MKSLTFTFEKSTKNAHRYGRERDAEGNVFGSLFISKSHTKTITGGSDEPPQTLKVSVSLDNDNEDA